jgi:hypothetical protein
LSSEKFEKIEMLVGLHLAEEEGIQPKVGEVHKISKIKINRYSLMGDPVAFYRSGIRRRNGLFLRRAPGERGIRG